MFYESIKKLVQYGINTGLTPECERVYTTNLLLELFHEDNYEDIDCDVTDLDLETILKELLDEAVKRGIIEDSVTYRDLFDTKMMNCLMPRPAQIQKEFKEKYNISPEEATSYYYKLSQDSDYIRRYRIKKDRKWTVETKYGTLDITINLSKPEKDPKAIAWKTKDMRAAPTILQEKIIELFRLRSRELIGAFNILLMFIITSTVSSLTENIFR